MNVILVGGDDMATTAEEVRDLTTKLCTISFASDLKECKTLEDFENLKRHYEELAKQMKPIH